MRFLLLVVAGAWALAVLSFHILESENRVLENTIKELNEKVIQLEEQNQELKLAREKEVAGLHRYFSSKNSPIAPYVSVFFDVRDKYGVSPYLLAAVAMAESGGCKRYIKSTNNCLGWGGGSIRFNSVGGGLLEVGRKISSLRSYDRFRRSGTIRDFAKAYNGPYWQDYEKKISYFLGEINDQKH